MFWQEVEEERETVTRTATIALIDTEQTTTSVEQRQEQSQKDKHSRHSRDVEAEKMTRDRRLMSTRHKTDNNRHSAVPASTDMTCRVVLVTSAESRHVDDAGGVS